MNVHEYQAKQFLARYDIAIPRGGVASSAAEAEDIARHLDASRWAIKAQVYAGGRSAGHFASNPQGEGGVRLVDSVAAVEQHVLQMLGDVLITEQTGSIGREVDRVYVEKAHDIERELYLGMLVDRSTSRVTLITSGAGGVDIETVAARAPESIRKTAIDPLSGLHAAQISDIVAALEVGAAGGLLVRGAPALCGNI